MKNLLATLTGTARRVEAIVRLRLKAKALGFPIRKKNQYLYGVGLEIGRPAYMQWEALVREGKAPDDLWPDAINGNTIGLYRLIRSYPDSYRGSDYAFGDSGRSGDFIIAGFVDIPTPQVIN